jgi:oxygen-independent coproporphyrinogen-3 oxidase
MASGRSAGYVCGVSSVQKDELVHVRPRVTGEPQEGALAAERPLGVYVHFPFCSVHCPYCDFAVDARPDIPHDRYADAVVAEVAARAPWFAGAALRSIYFGGGTPGLWRPDALGRVVAAILRGWGAATTAGLEITLEANPGEIDADRLAAWRAAGVNRLSLGAQSFDDELLRGLGRNHDVAAIARAVSAARAAGFANLTCDLMYGLPGQDEAGWLASVAALVALGPEHVSAYALTVERGTPFGARARAGSLVTPPDEDVAAMFERGRAALAAAGYEQYEVSSYARPGSRAVHNHLYWTGAAYLGVGASAASFRPLADGTGWRFSNPRATETYLRAVDAGAGNPRPAKIERRTQPELENEAIWLGLRTTDGVDRAAHRARFGADPLAGRERAAASARCVAAGWLSVTDADLRLTPAGLLFADEVASRLWRET